MNYSEALEYIHGTHKYGWKLGLSNITRLLDLLGNPHQKLKYVHIAGTNGKGSTAAFINRILMEAGYNVGIYTSPYLERFTERIRINDCEIPEAELARITGMVREKVEMMVGRGDNHPTEFEIVTAIAFQYFHESSCDVVVLEVGLGGRYDSTNVIDTPLVSVITTISYDHMDYLGNTLAEIAYEKAGIIKPDGDVVIYPQSEEAERVLRDTCSKRGARLRRVSFDTIAITEFNADGQVFNFEDYRSLKIGLLGEHQVRNAAVAINACEILRKKGFEITEGSIRAGLAKTKWPGRLEVLKKEPLFLIDGAHNAEGAEILSEMLRQYFPDKKIIFIIGVLKDKDFKSMIEAVVPAAELFIAVAPNSARALPAEDLAIFIKSYCKNVLVSDTIEEAIRTSLQVSGPEDVICAFGSLYYIGEVRKVFLEHRNLNL